MGGGDESTVAHRPGRQRAGDLVGGLDLRQGKTRRCRTQHTEEACSPAVGADEQFSCGDANAQHGVPERLTEPHGEFSVTAETSLRVGEHQCPGVCAGRADVESADADRVISFQREGPQLAVEVL